MIDFNRIYFRCLYLDRHVLSMLTWWLSILNAAEIHFSRETCAKTLFFCWSEVDCLAGGTWDHTRDANGHHRGGKAHRPLHSSKRGWHRTPRVNWGKTLQKMLFTENFMEYVNSLKILYMVMSLGHFSSWAKSLFYQPHSLVGSYFLDCRWGFLSHPGGKSYRVQVYPRIIGQRGHHESKM